MVKARLYLLKEDYESKEINCDKKKIKKEINYRKLEVKALK